MAILKDVAERCHKCGWTFTANDSAHVCIGGIGDINSTAKGSGARFNTGKPDYSLIPLSLIAESYADLYVIESDADYRLALKEIEGLMAADANTFESDRLEVLTTRVQAYERRHYPIDPPSTDAPNINAVAALNRLGQYQATQNRGDLYEILCLLGLEGWAECAAVFEYGKRKYAAWNWAKGMPWSVPLASCARHLKAMIDGETDDPESGRPHRGHVFCNVVMLLTYRTNYTEGNDLPEKGMLAA